MGENGNLGIKYIPTSVGMTKRLNSIFTLTFPQSQKQV